MNRRTILVIAGAMCGIALLLLVGNWPRSPRRETIRDHAPTSRVPESSERPIETQPGRGNLRLDKLGSVSRSEISNLIRQRTPEELSHLVAELERLRSGSQKSSAVAEFFKAWAEIDYRAAWQSALGLTDPSVKSTALRAVFEAVPTEAAAALTTMLRDASPLALAPMLRSELLAHGIAKWSEADAPVAAHFLEANPDATTAERRDTPGGISMLAGTIAHNWALNDPVAAMEWARNNPNASSAMQGAIGGWWEKDPEGAAAYVTQHLGTNTDHQVASILADRMAAQDPKRAAAWVAQLPNEWARRFGEMSIAQAWGWRDPKAAIDWAASLPAKERAEAWPVTAMSWARNDPQAAGEWIKTLEGPGRDETVATYGRSIAQLDPVTALSWTMSVSDQQMRDESVSQIVSVWISQQPDAARAWIAQNNLPSEQKTRLLKTGPGP